MRKIPTLGIRTMSALPFKENQWLHGKKYFEHSPLEDIVGPADGLFPLKAALVPEVGEEIVLYLRDQTNFMDSLCRVRPFQLMLKAGAGQNEYGPVCFFVFWVPNPANPSTPFLAYDLYLNPQDDAQVEVWRELARQTHWHLFLIGEAGKQREFFEFENTFNLDATLDFLTEACASIPVMNFDRAKDKFMQENTVGDLLQM